MYYFYLISNFWQHNICQSTSQNNTLMHSFYHCMIQQYQEQLYVSEEEDMESGSSLTNTYMEVVQKPYHGKINKSKNIRNCFMQIGIGASVTATYHQVTFCVVHV